MIYGNLADKYGKENKALVWQYCMCYFYFGVVIAFILCFFKYREGESEKGKNKVKIEEHIVNVNLMNSNDNDLLNLKINEIKDKSNKNDKKEIMHTTLFDDMESEKGEQ